MTISPIFSSGVRQETSRAIFWFLKVCGRFFRIISKALGLAAFRLDIRILPTMALG